MRPATTAVGYHWLTERAVTARNGRAGDCDSAAQSSRTTVDGRRQLPATRCEVREKRHSRECANSAKSQALMLLVRAASAHADIRLGRRIRQSVQPDEPRAMARPGVDFCVASEALSEPPPHPGGNLAPAADRIARASRSTSTVASKQDKRSACSRTARPHPQNFREGRNATRAQPDQNRAGHRPEIYFRLAERFAAAGTRIDRLAKTVRVLAGNFC